MEIIQIVGIGIIATILAVLLKQERPEISLQISIVTGLIIFIFVISKLSYVIKVLSNLAQRIDIDFIYFSTILKIIGIAYIAEFGAQISRDAGEETIASKIELAGKILIMALSVPILLAVLDLILKIMP
ncbi:stage III sporulation protein AD [Caloranaerobacter azorensis]|uniref:Stage III sporulation protein AD n=2 Tax=Caloranaerobacter azorensis TaxID=116090 RepID=A0A1M5RX11_9FIRM|nr:stage III sporulation protein AD [Caloranaerobacter azorensis]QIB26005.1 stage III sporulation protein AD [Caloranaerobacter azorensis]SHH30897.1 stage III sporulation protein AD [Caloranaerobacter azorensis DSM 13643]